MAARHSGSSSSGAWPRFPTVSRFRSGFSRAMRATVAALSKSDSAPRITSKGTRLSLAYSGHRSEGAVLGFLNASLIFGSTSGTGTPAGFSR